MIVLALVSAIAMTSLQTAAADSSRKAFVTCLHDVVEKAQAQKVAIDGFGAFVATECGPAQAKLKAALVGFDVKNKIPRKQAESDAQSSIDDYLATATDRYKATLPQ
jgi:O-glycosyl hydrolase